MVEDFALPDLVFGVSMLPALVQIALGGLLSIIYLGGVVVAFLFCIYWYGNKYGWTPGSRPRNLPQDAFEGVHRSAPRPPDSYQQDPFDWEQQPRRTKRQQDDELEWG